MDRWLARAVAVAFEPSLTDCVLMAALPALGVTLQALAGPDGAEPTDETEAVQRQAVWLEAAAVRVGVVVVVCVGRGSPEMGQRAVR